MTQEDVLEVLKGKRRWLTSREIAEKLKVNSSNITKHLRGLFNQREVLRKELKSPFGFYYYIWKKA